jgi:putative membrane protein
MTPGKDPNAERAAWLARPPEEELARKLGVAAWVFSGLVLVLVVCMQKIRLPLPEGWSTAFLPPLHAAVNAAAALVLMVSLICIKLGKVRLHRATMVAAMGLSVLFLLSYVAYHITNDPTRYGGTGPLRTVYFLLLITHIICAAVSLPFILFTFIAGWTNRFTAHRRLARWVFPLWLYVALTGPACYWMLRPYY